MKTKYLFVIGFFALLLSSCVTSKVSFNNSPDYHTKIKTAFVEIKDVNIGRFLDQFGSSLISNLENEGVSIKLIVNDVLSLNSEKDIQKQIQDFNPAVVMIIERADTKTTRSKSGYSYNGGVYLVSIELPETHKIVWKASISTRSEVGSFGGFDVAVKQTVQQIISKMKTDQLL